MSPATIRGASRATALVLLLSAPAAAFQSASLQTSTRGTVPQCEAPVDLRTWTAESYPAVSGFGAGVWTVAPDGSDVVQSVNGQPTMFYSDFEVMSSNVEGEILVTGGDDDYIGFALGFLPGDSTSNDAEYLLVDWKRGTQNFNFGTPSCSPGSVAPAGLAVSRVFGIPTADEFWGHVNFDDTCSDLDNGLEELARGTTLGASGWSTSTSYVFRFEFEPTRLRVFVDGFLELDVNGSFNPGRMAFYNFSQAGVTYSAFQRGALASWTPYGAGWPGANGVPSLTLSANPVLGTTVDVQVGNSATVDSLACLLLSSGSDAATTGFGGTLLVSRPFLQTTSIHPLPLAGATVPLVIPNDANLCGAQGYLQMFQFDAASSHGLAFSRGVSIVLGD